MKKSILISLISVVIISLFGICYINSDYSIISHYDMSCSRGRGLATLIRHMCNLSMYGWIYFFSSIGVSYLLSITLKIFIPKWMRYITKKRYPGFSLLIVPKNSVSIAVFLFLLLFAFCGYFSEEEDDILFFLWMGGGFTVYGIFTYMLTTFKGHLFMINQNSVFVSTFSLLGLFKRLEFNNLTKAEVEGKYWKICNKETKKTLFRIYTDSYSEHGQAKINEWLNKIQ